MPCNDILFQPKIEVCINNKCNSLCIKEVTDVLQTPYNTTGWGTPNINTSNVVSATVQIYNSSFTTLLNTFVVKNISVNLYPNLRPSPFVLANNFAWTQVDGVYGIIYTITTNTVTYVNKTQHSLFICNILNCRAKLICKIVDECDAIKLKEYKKVLDQLDVIIYSIESAYSIKDFDTVTKHIVAAHIICDNYDCGCSNC